MTAPLYQVKADFFRTLGHPARIRVLELLSERDHAVRELLEEVDIEASNLSQQLAVLRRAGLVSQQRLGGEVTYSLALPQLRELLKTARAVLLDQVTAQSSLQTSLREELAAPTSKRPT